MTNGIRDICTDITRMQSLEVLNQIYAQSNDFVW